MPAPVPGQLLIFVKKASSAIIYVQDGTSRRSITNAQGQHDETLYQGIRGAFILYGWDVTVHELQDIFVNWLTPSGGIDVKLDAILSNTDIPDPAPAGVTLGSRTQQIYDAVT